MNLSFHWFQFLFGLLFCAAPLAVASGAPGILIYQRNGKGFVHDNLEASAAAIRDLGHRHGFTTEASTNASIFSDESLRRFRAVVFANSNNEAFEKESQREAFQRYIRNGGGFVGIHSSTGSERNWHWFQQMQGAKFLRHSPMQSFNVAVVDSAHPATAHLNAAWTRTDECYFFTNLNPTIRVLLAVDTASLRDPQLGTSAAEKRQGLYPLAWCHEFDGGRRFYTSLGHKIEHYADPVFRKHLLGGIQWVLGANLPTTSPTASSP